MGSYQGDRGSEQSYMQTISQYCRMVLKNPRSCVFVSMANTCLHAGKANMALEVLEKGLRHHPSLPSALTLKGRALMELGRTGEARQALVVAASSSRENVVARKLLAQLYLESGEPEKGLELLDDIRSLWPEHEQPQTLYAQLKQAVESKTGTAGPADKTPGENRQKNEAISTLERWLNNATRMAKG